MKKLKSGVAQLRRLVIKCMRDTAARGEPIGMADPEMIEGLADSLERDPTQWFAAGMQLMQCGLIDGDTYSALQNDTAYDGRGIT